MHRYTLNDIIEILNDLDIEPWSNYCISGHLLFDLLEILEKNKGVIL